MAVPAATSAASAPAPLKRGVVEWHRETQEGWNLGQINSLHCRLFANHGITVADGIAQLDNLGRRFLNILYIIYVEPGFTIGVAAPDTYAAIVGIECSDEPFTAGQDEVQVGLGRKEGLPFAEFHSRKNLGIGVAVGLPGFQGSVIRYPEPVAVESSFYEHIIPMAIILQVHIRPGVL